MQRGTTAATRAPETKNRQPWNRCALRPVKADGSEGPAPSMLPMTDCVGRRDWTRTNDPHHVKVVL